MNRYGNVQFNFVMTPAVKWLLIANGTIWFVLQVLGEKYLNLPISQNFALIPFQIISNFEVWRLVSYMFLHSFSVSHIVFNMLMLWMIGAELEQRWGWKYFFGYYLGSGIGAAVIYAIGQTLYYLYVPDASSILAPVMGASGAVFGLLLAYGLIFGERIIHFMMIFPMKAKYFVMILGAIDLASMLSSSRGSSDVAYLAHLGGLLAGFLILKGTNLYQRILWGQKVKKRSRNLRLVVDNDDDAKKKDPNQGPRYWN